MIVLLFTYIYLLLNMYSRVFSLLFILFMCFKFFLKESICNIFVMVLYYFHLSKIMNNEYTIILYFIISLEMFLHI